MSLATLNSGFNTGVLLAVLLILSAGCSSSDKKTTTGGVVLHPIMEDIPHYNRKHIAIDQNQPFSELIKKPKELELLYQYLQDPDELATKKLDVMVSSPFNFHVSSADKHRLILLEAFKNRLFEYNLKTGNTTSLAEVGEGPGDINFPQEIVKRNTSIFVAMADMRVSRFNCGTVPCTYQETLNTTFRPYSLAPAGDSLAVLGSIAVTGPSGPELKKKLEDLKAVHLLDSGGNEVGLFGDTYDTGGHWMLQRPFISSGMIRYSPEEKLYILAFERFPFLYIYDTDMELKTTYKVSDFILGQQEYRPKKGRLTILQVDYSVIRNISVIDRSLVWIETEARTNRRTVDKRRIHDRQYTYYVLDLNSGNNYYLGSLKLEGSDPEQSVHLTEYGLLINRDGSLLWAGM